VLPLIRKDTLEFFPQSSPAVPVSAPEKLAKFRLSFPTNDNDSLAARDETAPVFQDHVLELRAKDSVVAGW
jgi:hypothetical protein